MTVLKVDYPATYAAIVADADVLVGLDKLARREGLLPKEKRLLSLYISPDELTDEAALKQVGITGSTGDGATAAVAVPSEPLENVTSLLAYLSRTRDWFDEVDSILPFLYIGQDEVDRRLGSGEARRIRGMLANAQTEMLAEHIKVLVAEDETAKNEAGLDGYVELVDDLLSELSGIELSNARNAAVKTLSVLPVNHRTRLADRIGRFVSEPGVEIDMEDVITAATSACDELSKHALMDIVISRPSDVEVWTDRALVVSAHLSQLSEAGLPQPASSPFLIGAIERATEANSLVAVQKWLSAFQGETSTVAVPLLTRPLVLGYLKVLGAQSVGAPQPADGDVRLRLCSRQCQKTAKLLTRLRSMPKT